MLHYCGVRSEKVRRGCDCLITGLQSHYQLKGLWKSNTEEMFEMRFAEKDWGWSLSDGEVLYLGEQQVMIPNYKLTSKVDDSDRLISMLLGSGEKNKSWR